MFHDLRRASSACPPDVEVTATKRGVALGGQEPIVSYDATQIQAFGATNIGELVTLLEAQTRSARGGSPVFLVNGRRISGFREIRGIPPEAIERFEVLPEETALSYGYSANQRVVNIVLKADFRSLTASVNVSRPEQGGRTTTASENNLLKIAGADRWSMDINGSTSNPLYEDERDIDRSGTTRQDSVADRDLNAYRTLLPRSAEASVAGTYKHDLNDKVGMTLSGSLTDSASRSYLGLPGVSLTLPDGNPWSPGGDATTLYRYLDLPQALTRQTNTRSAELGAVFDGYLGDWRWTATGEYSRIRTDTVTGRGVEDDDLLARIAAGDTTVNPYGDLTGAVGPVRRDTAQSISQSLEGEVVLNGTAWELPAGGITTTFKFGGEHQALDSESVRSGVATDRSQSRDLGSVQANFDLPIASVDRGVLAGIGDLSANMNLAYQELSDFGGVSSIGGGLNWSPVERLSLSANYSDEGKAPTVQQLNDPTIATPNTPVFDYATNQTVEITQISGGDPNLYRYVGNAPTSTTDPSGLDTPSAYGLMHAVAQEARTVQGVSLDDIPFVQPLQPTPAWQKSKLPSTMYIPRFLDWYPNAISLVIRALGGQEWLGEDWGVRLVSYSTAESCVARSTIRLNVRPIKQSLVDTTSALFATHPPQHAGGQAFTRSEMVALANSFADAYIRAVDRFLQEHPGASPGQGTRYPWENATNTPVCEDWQKGLLRLLLTDPAVKQGDLVLRAGEWGTERAGHNVVMVFPRAHVASFDVSKQTSGGNAAYPFIVLDPHWDILPRAFQYETWRSRTGYTIERMSLPGIGLND